MKIINSINSESPVNLSITLSADTLIVSKKDLKNVIREMVSDIQSEQDINDVFTLKEAAAYMKISRQKLTQLINSRAFPCFRDGQVIRIRKVDILEVLDSSRNVEPSKISEVDGCRKVG